MARGSFFAGAIKTGILGAALIAGLAAPGYAADAPKLTLTGSATFATDYMFRSITNSNQLPAVQPEFDLTYGMWWAYIWGSNTQFGEGIEIDYGAGISPKWKNITFTIGGIEYTYPGQNDIDYFELKSGASWNGGGPWTLSVNDWWSPDNFQAFGQSNAIEGAVAYAFKGKLWNFFTPSISGTIGFQSYEEVASDYTYWNAGLTLGFLGHWSGDIRYYDTTYNREECFIQNGNRNGCGARAVGAIKVTF
jgi:uncharacterized protein (TIGR02001 family)